MLKGVKDLELLVLLLLLCFGGFFLRAKFDVVVPPKLEKAVVDANGYSLLNNNGFSVCYSTKDNHPVYVAYRLFPQPSFQPTDAPDQCVSDPRVSNTASLGNRGLEWRHLAEPRLMAAYHGSAAQAAAGYATGAAPCFRGSDNKAWNSIIDLEGGVYPKKFGGVDVVCGPLYRDPAPVTSSGVPIPYAFFKVISRGDGDVLSFVVPQQPSSSDPVSYLVPLMDIDSRIGFSLIPEATNRSVVPSGMW